MPVGHVRTSASVSWKGAWSRTPPGWTDLRRAVGAGLGGGARHRLLARAAGAHTEELCPLPDPGAPLTPLVVGATGVSTGPWGTAARRALREGGPCIDRPPSRTTPFALRAPLADRANPLALGVAGTGGRQAGPVIRHRM